MIMLVIIDIINLYEDMSFIIENWELDQLKWIYSYFNFFENLR